MKKKIMILIIILFVFVTLFIILKQQGVISSNSSGLKEKLKGQMRNVVITTENLPETLSTSEIIRDVPKEALISLNVDDNYYAIESSHINREKIENPDISVSLPSDYLNRLSEDFCGTLSEAYSNGELKIEVRISKIEAVWKYMSMFKYKSCLGI